jgi:hypothetical protein
MKTICKKATLLAAAAFALFVGEANAQMSFAAEGRVGVTLPQGDLSDAGVESGIALGGELQANFTTNLSAYLGLNRYAFRCDDCDFGENPSSTGIGAGLKWVFHNPGDVLVWGRGGVVFNKLASDDGDRDREAGFEVGAGADLSIAERLYLVPSLSFVSHGAGGNFKANFFTLGLGLHYHFN